jgi:hypothetical protein
LLQDFAMRAVLTTYDRVQLGYAQSLLQQAGIETVVLDGSLNAYDTLHWQAMRLAVIEDGDALEAERILNEGMAKGTPQGG